MSTAISDRKDGAIAALRSTALAGREVPTRVRLTPWGEIESTNGRFVVDDESARQVVEAFEAHRTDLPIDYEHQTLGGRFASPNGRAPAAGWIKRIDPVPGEGLIAEIEWTDEARSLLSDKQYRYLSPVALMRRADRKLIAIHSAALTNKPAIVGQQAIVQRDDSATELAPNIELHRLREELDLHEDAQADEVLVAAGQRIAQLQREAQERHVAERIAEAMAAGKLVEAQRAWGEALVAREEGLFDEWLRTAPTIVRPGRTAPPVTGCAAVPRQETIASSARAEFRSHPLLARLTTEEAFVADALRGAGAN